MESASITIRVLTDADAEAFWALRLQGLRDDPESFGADYEEALDLPPAQIAERIKQTANNFVLGAFTDHLVGMVGLRRIDGKKARHKAMVWGMYVAPEARGKQIARRLMRELIARAKTIDGLERLQLSVVTTKEPARQLYRSLGFTVYGIEPQGLKVGDKYVDEELMLLPLA